MSEQDKTKDASQEFVEAIMEAGQGLSDKLQELYEEGPDKTTMAGYVVALTCEAVFWTHMLQATGSDIEAVLRYQEYGQRMGKQSFMNFLSSLEDEQKVQALRDTVKPS